MNWRARVCATMLLTTIAGPAFADPTKRECIDANAQAQVEMNAGRLRAGRRALQSCAVRACPGTVRRDCNERLEALAPRIPSLVVEAKDPVGNDLAAVSVRMDGELLVARLDGTAIELDPGEHHFTFETADASPVERTIIIREGEVARREKVVLGKSAPVVAEPEPVAMPAHTRHAEQGRGQRIAGLAVGGVGVVGLVVGGIFGAFALANWNRSKGACGKDSLPSCSVGTNRATALDDHGSAESNATTSTIGFIVGGVLVAGGLVLYVTAPKARTTVGVAPSASGAMLVSSF